MDASSSRHNRKTVVNGFSNTLLLYFFDLSTSTILQNHQQRILFKTNKKEIHVELTKKKRSQYICDDHDGHKKVLLLKNDTIY